MHRNSFSSLMLAGLLSGTYVHAAQTGSQIVNYFTNPIFNGRLDPVVQPGVVSNHVHQVFGGGNFSPYMSQNQAADSACTANQISADRSNYWEPGLFFNAPNGSFFQVPAREYKVYYAFEETSDDMVPFPIGLHMVAGDAMARTPPGPSGHNIDPAQGVVIPYEIQCVDTNVAFTDEFCTDYGGLRINVYFPQCYNPQAGLTNYQNNTVYATSQDAPSGKICPEGWLHLPQLNLEVYYDVHQFDNDWTPGQGHIPWCLAQGDCTGAGAHADFIAGWDQEVGAGLIANCASVAEFGNGGMDTCYPELVVSAADGAACTIASPIDEDVWGELRALPGCNPIQGAPGPATIKTGCGATTTLGTPETQYTDLTAKLDWEYYGCFTDTQNNARALTHGYPNKGTIEDCIAECTTAGYSYAGLEVGDQCYCDNSLTPSNGNGVPSGLCNQQCIGNNKEICGGVSVLSVYRKCTGTCVNGSGPVATGQQNGTYLLDALNYPNATTKRIRSSWAETLRRP
ncbi:hypothetical protein B7494_g5918 [Chlorociboria aeruginascens]|nr:hypothetical protein B7494_g5918 [Chlorociboria aeruginascens]